MIQFSPLVTYPSAGHHNGDLGATANGYREGELTQELRNLVVKELSRLNVKYITDKDDENNRQYQGRIRPGAGSVIFDIHFNAGPPTATGTEVIVANEANERSKQFAKELADGTAKILGIRNRGVKDETGTHYSRIGILRLPAGTAALMEVCFITNMSDMAAYQVNKERLAAFYAETLKKYDDMI